MGTWTQFNDTLVNNPITGLPWTNAEINALQLGGGVERYRQGGAGKNSTSRITSMWIVVFTTSIEPIGGGSALLLL